MDRSQWCEELGRVPPGAVNDTSVRCSQPEQNAAMPPRTAEATRSDGVKQSGIGRDGMPSADAPHHFAAGALAR